MDPRDFTFNSDYPIDQVLEVLDSAVLGGITIPANTHITRTFNTVIQEAMLPEGNYSVRGVDGAKAPFGGLIYISANPTYFSPNVQVWIKSSPGSITLYIANTDNSNAHTIDFQIALLARSDQGPVDAQPLPAEFTFDTDLNYLKIAKDEIIATTAAAVNSPSLSSTAVYETSHNLGYVPILRAYMEYDGEIMPCGDGNTGLINTQVAIKSGIDANTVNYTVFNTRGAGNEPARAYRVHSRIYYDS